MYQIDQTTCTYCAGCSAVCPECSIVVNENDITIIDTCCDCGLCGEFCPVSAIEKSES